MSAHDAHYGGDLVDGARMLALFGDVATELLIRGDGDEGLFAGYAIVEFLAPVLAGDYIEAQGRDRSLRPNVARDGVRSPQGDRRAARHRRQRGRGASGATSSSAARAARASCRRTNRGAATRLDKFLKVSRLAKRRTRGRRGAAQRPHDARRAAAQAGLRGESRRRLTIHYATKYLAVRVSRGSVACDAGAQAGRPLRGHRRTARRGRRLAAVTQGALRRREGRAGPRDSGRRHTAAARCAPDWPRSARGRAAVFRTRRPAIARLYRSLSPGGGAIRRAHSARLGGIATYEIDLDASRRRRRCRPRAAIVAWSCAARFSPAVRSPQPAHGYHLEFIPPTPALTARLCAIAARRGTRAEAGRAARAATSSTSRTPMRSSAC